MNESIPLAAEAARVVAILEDEALLADLAAELCAGLGLRPQVYSTPAPFLDMVRDVPPAVLVLDWRLQDQLAAAAFMAVRHRHPALPVVCWTASPPGRLPQMIREDPMTQVVDKATAATGLESALRQALAMVEPLPEGAEMSDLFRIPNEINPDEPSGLTPDMNPIDDAFLRDQELERQEHQGDEDDDEGDEAGDPA